MSFLLESDVGSVSPEKESPLIVLWNNTKGVFIRRVELYSYRDRIFVSVPVHHLNKKRTGSRYNRRRMESVERVSVSYKGVL